MYMYAASTMRDLLEDCLPVLVAPLVVAHPYELRFGEAVRLYIRALLLLMVGRISCLIIWITWRTTRRWSHGLSDWGSAGRAAGGRVRAARYRRNDLGLVAELVSDEVGEAPTRTPTGLEHRSGS